MICCLTIRSDLSKQNDDDDELCWKNSTLDFDSSFEITKLSLFCVNFVQLLNYNCEK